MLPELDVFHADSEQFVHPEWVTLHHKDLVFVTPAGQRSHRYTWLQYEEQGGVQPQPFNPTHPPNVIGLMVELGRV